MRAEAAVPSASFLMKTVSGLHTFLYRASRGRLGGTISSLPVLLLTTSGRKTKKRRTRPLVYLRDGADLVLIASNGGHDWHPAWYLNLRANPAPEVQVRGQRVAVTARPAEPAERERLWPKVVALYAGYAKYQAKTGRLIPLVILEGGGRITDSTIHF
jgi:deazaflavin-dependent oxidoreductase (nitroreductase family)